ncbi:hypothetical protein [Providencia sp. PROV033]|uniref:hypothetical protein n=1 Tax=Providencia sp. PROV033 TaxID=2949765 RepID=UPI00234AA379|nr:hypothetical protein [Providencia sp. PROV033]
MKKLNARIEHELTMHFAELYHKGSTYIATFKLLQWFEKDGGKITQAFFKREIFERWFEYMEVENDDEDWQLSVINVLSDHSVKKPEGYILFQNSSLYINSQSENNEDEDEDESE